MEQNVLCIEREVLRFSREVEWTGFTLWVLQQVKKWIPVLVSWQHTLTQFPQQFIGCGSICDLFYPSGHSYIITLILHNYAQQPKRAILSSPLFPATHSSPCAGPSICMIGQWAESRNQSGWKLSPNPQLQYLFTVEQLMRYLRSLRFAWLWVKLSPKEVHPLGSCFCLTQWGCGAFLDKRFSGALAAGLLVTHKFADYT